MYEVSEAFHRQYADMYDKFVRIYFKDGSVRTGLFNDEFYDDSSICQTLAGRFFSGSAHICIMRFFKHVNKALPKK